MVWNLEIFLRDMEAWRAVHNFDLRERTAVAVLRVEETDKAYELSLDTYGGIATDHMDSLHGQCMDRRLEADELLLENIVADREMAEEQGMLEQYRKGGLFHTWAQFQSGYPIYELRDEIPSDSLLRKRVECVCDALLLVSLDPLRVSSLPASKELADKERADALETTRTVVEELTSPKMLAFAMGAHKRLRISSGIANLSDDNMRMISSLACEAPYVL
jgi:hypothetical protein